MKVAPKKEVCELGVVFVRNTDLDRTYGSLLNEVHYQRRRNGGVFTSAGDRSIANLYLLVDLHGIRPPFTERTTDTIHNGDFNFLHGFRCCVRALVFNVYFNWLDR